MANNRMILVHRPSKVGIVIAKRLGCGWATSKNKGNALNQFFQYIEDNTKYKDQDDFILLQEGAFMKNRFYTSCKLVGKDWNYGDRIDGVPYRYFEYDPDKIIGVTHE